MKSIDSYGSAVWALILRQWCWSNVVVVLLRCVGSFSVFCEVRSVVMVPSCSCMWLWL